jgi:hypothetical protein
MDQEEASREGSLTPEEILARFKKCFGRDMTARERQIFFLGPEPLKQNQG